MAERAVFYQLTHKYVNQDQDIPEQSRQVIYYSLAIGHHVGVLDCFQRMLEVPLEDYRHWLAQMPEGPGRHKLEGLLKWGEIEINRSHAPDLVPTLKDSLSRMDETGSKCTGLLLQYLQKMIEEPALYLMVRKHA
ncbi:MAG TPA: formate hydrogenlyase maturation protein HycH [Anaerolineales bacterium]|nr:formate hydrogenlyase maturation protein HycH [Anaerolineales bacterium]